MANQAPGTHQGSDRRIKCNVCLYREQGSFVNKVEGFRIGTYIFISGPGIQLRYYTGRVVKTKFTFDSPDFPDSFLSSGPQCNFVTATQNKFKSRSHGMACELHSERIIHTKCLSACSSFQYNKLSTGTACFPYLFTYRHVRRLRIEAAPG